MRVLLDREKWRGKRQTWRVDRSEKGLRENDKQEDQLSLWSFWVTAGCHDFISYLEGENPDSGNTARIDVGWAMEMLPPNIPFEWYYLPYSTIHWKITLKTPLRKSETSYFVYYFLCHWHLLTRCWTEHCKTSSQRHHSKQQHFYQLGCTKRNSTHSVHSVQLTHHKEFVFCSSTSTFKPACTQRSMVQRIVSWAHSHTQQSHSWVGHHEHFPLLNAHHLGYVAKWEGPPVYFYICINDSRGSWTHH